VQACSGLCDCATNQPKCRFFFLTSTEIQQITFNTTSAGIIEKIAFKEAVHPMKSLDDLRRRLGPNRRVFALFHPLLPEEPLVILHVHLENKPRQYPRNH
jgi:malonyl-CoA decarboxylase